MLATLLSCEFIVSPSLSSESCVEDRIEDLVALRRAVREKVHAVLIEDQAMDKLVEEQKYPTQNLFEQSLRRAGIVSYSAQDVSKIVNNILSEAVEISSSKPDYLFEFVVSSCEPDFRGITPGRRDALLELLGIIAARSCWAGLRGGLLHTCNYNCFDRVRLQSQVHCVVPDQSVKYPAQIVHDQLLFSSYGEWLDAQDPVAAYNDASCDDDVKFAIYLAARGKRKQAGADISDFTLKSFKLSNDFVASLARNQSCGRQKFGGAVLEAAADIVSGISVRDIGPFWSQESEGEARMRLDYEACRTHVTKGNEGMRLMFWRRADGHIVLANVGTKNELRISRI